MRLRRLYVNSERAKFFTVTTVNNDRLEFHYFWRSKTKAWYLNLVHHDTGETLKTGVRLEPNSRPLDTANLLDDPFIFIVGGKEYNKQEHLGDRINIYLLDRYD